MKESNQWLCGSSRGYSIRVYSGSSWVLCWQMEKQADMVQVQDGAEALSDLARL